VVVSRAEELTSRILSYGFECEAGPLENCAEFQELIAVLAQRDERIAELEQKIDAFKENFARRLDIAAQQLAAADIRLARAEVPEWCKEIVDMCHNWERSGGYPEDACALAYLDKLIKALTPDQLRACGIEVP